MLKKLFKEIFVTDPFRIVPEATLLYDTRRTWNKVLL